MLDSVMTFVVLILIVLWILDALGVLELVSAVTELISAVVAAVLWLAAWAIRRAIRKPIPPPPSQESLPRGGRAGPRGSRKPPTD